MDYDVVIVGARVGGAAAAMLLARRGLRVLVVDRGRYGTDTLSTHALMRGGVLLLSRWGVLDRITAAGTPAIRETRFYYGDDDPVTIGIKPAHGVDALYAPRRTLLDPVLVDAAVQAGAEVRFGVSVTDLLRDGTGRVVGVRGRSSFTAYAGLVVGADGIRSTVARCVGAPATRMGSGAAAVIYGYWSDMDVNVYEWFYRNGSSFGFIPTGDGETCVFVGVPASSLPADRPALYRRLLDPVAVRLAGARPPQRLHTWVGRPGFLRQASGPGWALVGDAGGFVDPLSTHGITDALRDACLLDRFVASGDLPRFGPVRDAVVGPIFDAADRIAGYAWTLAEVRDHLRTLNAAMNAELEALL